VVVAGVAGKDVSAGAADVIGCSVVVTLVAVDATQFRTQISYRASRLPVVAVTPV